MQIAANIANESAVNGSWIAVWSKDQEDNVFIQVAYPYNAITI